jgi:SAM-dependent methyltransferase
MCNAACLAFGRAQLRREEVEGQRVLEVGARDLNGSLRADIARLRPASHLGVDVAEGPGVDELCDVGELAARYGAASFDVVVSTELLEHVRDWRSAVSNLKQVLRPGGVLLVTARSRGFPYHGYPHDYWRYEADDLRIAFGDLAIEALERDPSAPGVFLKARKPQGFAERDLARVELFSVLAARRCREVSDLRVALARAAQRLRGLAARAFGGRS